ncbi:hypothetical protein [Paraliobacillus ryukyuensis]|uniref:hypothetical protein n=1 Tax=Paraliobacillus ryukyuensis TaxID=200904 RepID=UPI00117F5BDF|nr:hypothetical protein [Paraliobacillus ryukyuensis]
MQTLDSPVFELNKESDYYKKIKEVKDSQPIINEILDQVASKLEIDPKEFLYYNAGGFGFEKYTDSYMKYQDKLTKNPDRNGVHTFKRSTNEFKEISSMINEIDKIKKTVNPFALHDIFGFNNLKASQWIGDRFFVGVKSEERTMGNVEERKNQSIEPVKDISYKEYLKLVMEHTD